MGLLGSFGYGVTSLIVVSKKEERRKERRSCPYFYLYRAKSSRGTVNVRERLLLWNLGLERFDFGACVGQQFKHFFLIDKEKHKTRHQRANTGQNRTRWAGTHLNGHPKVVTIFNFRDLELHPHGHLPRQKEEKPEIVRVRVVVGRRLTMFSFSFSVWISGLTTCNSPSTFSLQEMGPQGGPAGQGPKRLH